MSLPRLRLEKSSFKDGVWYISPEEAHHLVKVRRCFNGASAEGLLDGEKIRLKLCVSVDGVTAVEVKRETESPPYPEIHLLLALLKNDQFDASLRFAAEIGVTKIHLLVCERSVPKYSNERAREKLARWRKILDESTKQAGSTRAPLLEAPVAPRKLVFNALPRCRYAAVLSESAEPLNKTEINSPVAVAIGPEGDWSPDETTLLLDSGFKPISLGKRILRASTAVAVACSWFALSAGENDQTAP